MSNKTFKYDLIFSIGAECFCTQALRNAGLQKKSYPLDWLFGGENELSGIFFRINCIKTKFKDWFLKDDLEYVSDRLKSKRLKIYKNKKTNLVFNHDFPMDEPFDSAYEKVNEKYNRRITRLISQIKKSKKVLMAYMVEPNSAERLDKEKVFEAIVELKKAYPKTQIDLLFVHCSDSKEVSMQIDKQAGITLYQISADFRSATFYLGRESWDYKVFAEILKVFELKIPFYKNIIIFINLFPKIFLLFRLKFSIL